LFCILSYQHLVSEIFCWKETITVIVFWGLGSMSTHLSSLWLQRAF
jgi:hypothetical protein